MQVQAGIGAGDNTSPRDFVEVIKVNSKRRVELEVLDSDGNFVDISEATLPTGEADGYLDLDLTSLGENAVFSETYWPNPVPSSRRITKASTGNYYVTLGDVSGETSSTGTYVANWTARINASSEEMVNTTVIEIVSSRVLSLLPRLRLQIDRSLKVVDLSSYCFLGYTQPMLVLFLRSALEYINSFQPYISWSNLDFFPIERYAEILIKAATYVALESQMLFALDTDTQGFSTNGHSYQLLHQSPLANYLSSLRAELENRIPSFKLHFVRSGTAKVELTPDYAFASLLSTAPWGTNFRGLYTAQ